MKRTLSRVGRALPGVLLLPAAVAAIFGGCADEDGAPPKPTATAATVPATGVSDAAGVYARVSPALALVSGAGGSGAGLLLDGGYVLTAAHLVSAGGTVRVSLPGAKAAEELPVAAIDVLTNLAALGPMETAVKPPPLAEAGATAVGSDLYVLGYAAGQESVAIARALLAARVRWESADLTLVQLDIPGLRLDGLLVAVDTSGRVVAVRAFAGGEAPSSLALDAAAVNGRIRGLVGAAAPGAANARVILGPKRLPVQQFELNLLVNERLLAFEPPVGTPTTLIVGGSAPVSVIVTSAAGAVVGEAKAAAGEKARLTMIARGGGPHLALVRLAGPPPKGEAVVVEASSDVNLALFTDPDDLQVLKAGSAFVGSIDFPGDSDVLVLDLAAGQVATIRVSSGGLDPLLEVTGAPDLVLLDDDSGRGVFGTDALLEFKAPATGRYAVRVTDALLQRAGGYVVTYRGASSDAQIQASVAQVAGLLESLAGDPRGEAAIRELLASLGRGAGPRLPAAYGAAWRGTAPGGAPLTEVATTSAVEAPAGARTVQDADGRFTVRVTLRVEDAGAAKLLVTNAGGAVVGSGPGGAGLSLACGAGLACVGTTSLEVADAAAAGPWTASLVGLQGGVSGWQIEVIRESADLERPSLPAEQP